MRRSRIAWLVLVLLVVAGVVALARLGSERASGAPIRVAFAGPVSGPSAEDGRSAVRAIELVFDRVNGAGGVAGRPLVLDVYDDANDPERARANASRIADEPGTIAVLGHNLTVCSLAAGEIYAARGIPAITHAATNVAVTRDNESYFRTVVNDDIQGRFVVAYAAKVLSAERFGIVHESQAYGTYLAEVMAAAAPEAGIELSGVFRLDAADPRQDARLDEIAAAVTGPDAPPLLVLAMQPAGGVGLVRRLRDRSYAGTLVVTDALASRAFADGFAELPGALADPGFYTDGIYASVPFLFDAANQAAAEFMVAYVARYDEAPDWYAALAADAALAVVEALRRAELAPGPRTISQDRARLRDALAAIGAANPADGVTGPIAFDSIGDAVKPMPMGRFHGGEIVSALAQLQLVRGLRRAEDLDTTLDPARLVKLGNRFLYRTDVARAGVRARHFGAIDFASGTFELEFDLWFRHRGDRGVENVEFTNAVEPVALGEPVDEVIDGPLQYRLYRAHGQFQADTVDVEYGAHALALSFHHRDRTRMDLIFAIDSLGMGLGRGRSRAQRGARARSLLGSNSDWSVRDVFSFESEVEEPALGHPGYLGLRAARPFSQLTIGVDLRRQAMSLRGMLPPPLRTGLLALGLAGSVVVLFAGRTKLQWLLQSAFALCLLLAAEPVLGNWLRGVASPYQLGQLSRVFDVLWWLVPAALLNGAVDRFLWKPAEERGGRPVPTLLRYTVSTLLLMLAFFGIVAFVYDYKLTGLLATSGVLAMILGLAVQINITNLFAGVALNLERPFRVGDWIMIHGRTPDPEDGVIGMVVDVNWRTTRLRTSDDTEIVIPNGVISEKTITNFMSPHEMSRFQVLFRVDQSVPPETVIPVIEGAVAAVTGSPRGPLADPKPSVRINRTTENGVEYCVRYRIVPRDVSPAKARHTVNEAVIRGLRDAGIELAYPHRLVREETPRS